MLRSRRPARAPRCTSPDPRWDDDDLDQLKAIPAIALEAVKTGPLIEG